MKDTSAHSPDTPAQYPTLPSYHDDLSPVTTLHLIAGGRHKPMTVLRTALANCGA